MPGWNRENTFTPFSAEGSGELQLLLSAEDAEDAENCNFFCPRRTRRGAENCNFFCPRRTRRGAENCNFFCPRRTRRGAENCNFFCPRRTRRTRRTATSFVRGGRGGARRTATSFVRGGRGGARRTAFFPQTDVSEAWVLGRGWGRAGAGRVCGCLSQMQVWRGVQSNWGGMVMERPVMWLPVTSSFFHRAGSVDLSRLPSFPRKAAAGQAALPALSRR